MPMLKNYFDPAIYGPDWIAIAFGYKASVETWLVYTSAFLPRRTKQEKPNPAASGSITVESLLPAGDTDGALGRYPQNGNRRAIVGVWRQSLGKWQMYWADNPSFDGSSAYMPYKTTGDANVYVAPGDKRWLSFNGDRMPGGVPWWDMQLQIHTSGNEDGAEVAMLLLPQVAVSGTDPAYFNPGEGSAPGPGNDKCFVTVRLTERVNRCETTAKRN